MGTNLTNIFTPKDLKNFASTISDIIGLSYGVNKKTGTRFARANLQNGITLIKELTASGVVKETVFKIPAFNSIAERNNIIKDLSKNQHMTQDMIASLMNISQSTVSNVLRKS